VGRRSQVVGASIEAMVDVSLRRYRTDGRLAWASTYPEVRFVGKGRARTTGKALPDRCVALRDLGGQLLWIEIKTWEGKDRHSLSQRLHQFEQMREFAADGGALGAYLVAWRWDGHIDWRIYPVANLICKRGSVLFVREAGIPVIESAGYPDWLPALLNIMVVKGDGHVAESCS
jgi:hypothetical protein